MNTLNNDQNNVSMRKLSFDEMAEINGGITRAERNWGCVALGLAAGIGAGWNPAVGGLTTLGCMLIQDYDE